jgi:hypothetical protein
MPFDPEKFNEFKKSGFDQNKFNAFKAAQSKPVTSRQEPMFDPASGAALGYTETAVAPTPMSYGEQMGNVAEFYKEAGKGAALGIPSAVFGMPGDIESLGRFGLNLVGAGVEPESALPTTERVYGGVRGVFTDEPMSLGEKMGAGVGELIGGFIGPGQAAKGLRAAGEAAVGAPSALSKKLAEVAEKKYGIKLEPMQVREAKPMGSPGFGTERQISNQEAVNKAVSRETGKETSSVTPQFVQERLGKIGDELNTIYGRQFVIDGEIANAAKAAADFERQIGVASDPKVAGIGENIFRRWEVENIKQKELQIQQLLGKKGRAGAEEVGEYVMRKFGPGERIDAAPITPEVWNAYQKMTVGRWDNLRPITVNPPEWAGDVMKVMNELTEKLGLRVRPGFYVAEHAGGTYGFTHPMGHIVLNESVLKSGKDALETAIHEFGHQAEFQLFKYAEPSVKKAITDAWAAENKAIPLGSKTVEQYRPITSSKYPDANRQALVKGNAYGRYIRNFQEWYAEQVSRFITTKAEPLTVVDKFFKGIADMWKAVYTRVVGHTPLSKEVDDFMRQSWQGKAIDQEAMREVFQLKAAAEPVAGGTPVATPVAPVGKVTAKIDGSQLQALRSTLSRITAAGGLHADRAKELLQQIDAAIARQNPKIAKQLAEANRKYTAAKTLDDLIKSRSPGIFGGNVSLDELGKELASRGVGTRHPLYELGQIGQQLKVRGRFEGPEYPGQDVMTALMGRAGRALSTVVGGRSDIARAVQKRMTPASERAGGVSKKQLATTGAAEAGRALEEEE